MKNYVVMLAVLVLMLVFGNMSFAQDCKNGKCQQPKSGFVVPKGYTLVPKSDCPNGKCPSCECPKGTCEKGTCIGSSYTKRPLRNFLRAVLRR